MGTRHGLTLAMAGLFVAIAACGDDDDDGLDPGTDFQASLSGADEVPAVTTTATGTATISIGADLIAYRVEVENLENVLFSHIHVAPPGENGDVRLNLCGTDDTDDCTSGTGVLIEGSNGATIDISFDSLVSAIRAGNAYVNVHTTQVVTGEIRGQLEPQ